MLVVDEESYCLVGFTSCYDIYALELGEFEIKVGSFEGEEKCV